MSLKLKGYIDLPANLKEGGFDHVAIHTALNRLYVAHTANDALDVIDCLEDSYLSSIPDLKAVAGALVSEESNLIFSSNRGENTLGIFSPDNDTELVKVPVGIRPNGVAYDPRSGIVLVACSARLGAVLGNRASPCALRTRVTVDSEVLMP
jgi:DNA-binding beta-propeller fold protein YncE